MDFGALPPPGPVVAGAATALGSRQKCAAVKDRGGGLGAAALGETEDDAEIVDVGVERASGGFAE
ncbi:MAG: hypothetical protein NVSMB9_12870 [Isosphaeraceae bacterium]